jgi:hypothetical protein
MKKVTLLIFCVFSSFILISSGCGPSLKRVKVSDEAMEAEAQKQRELAFAKSVERNEKLQNVAFQVSAAGAEICGENVDTRYGIFVVNTNGYKEEYRDIASHYYNITEDETIISYVHPKGPGAQAGLRRGDRLLSIYGEPVEGKNVSELYTFVKSKEQPLHLLVEREGEELAFDVHGIESCKYQVLLINQDSINAYADGRNVYVTSGMLRFVESEDELALVIGHEISHNSLGHLTKRRGNAALGTLFDILVTVATGVDTQGAFGGIGAMAYSQAFEAEADYSGIYISARAGYDINMAPDFWRSLAVENPSAIEKGYAASHPSTPERSAAMDECIKEIEEKRLASLPLLPDRKPGESEKGKDSVEHPTDRDTKGENDFYGDEIPPHEREWLPPSHRQLKED